MQSKRTLALFLVLVSSVPGLAIAAGKGRLICTVVDTGGNPISDVSVTIRSKGSPSFDEKKTTDRKGIFNLKFSGDRGLYLIRLEKQGRRSLEGELELHAGKAMRFEFTMHKAGSSSEEVDEDHSDQIIETACFKGSTVQQWVGLHNIYVYAQCDAEKHYLLAMRVRCIGLRDAPKISLADISGRVCSDTQAGILYEDTSGNPGACSIRRIEEVEGKAEAEDLVMMRIGVVRN